jgi:16S rRNA processing protein RimM
VHGAVKVKPVTEQPSRFKALKKVVIEYPEGLRKEVTLSNVSVRDTYIYVAIEGVESRADARSLSGALIGIRNDELLPLEPGRFYHFELLDCAVETTAGDGIGNVMDVLDLSANAVLVVRNDNREFLIPLIKDVVKEVDVHDGRIVIEPIEGLLD